MSFGYHLREAGKEALCLPAGIAFGLALKGAEHPKMSVLTAVALSALTYAAAGSVALAALSAVVVLGSTSTAYFVAKLICASQKG